MNRITLNRILGIIFILSGVAKAFNIGAFAFEIMNYSAAYLTTKLWSWANYIAIMICFLEVFWGLLALRSVYATLSSVVFFIMLLFFTWLTGINYLAPTPSGSIESCGCFGELIHFSPLESFVKSILLLSLATFSMYSSLTSGRTWNIAILIKDVYVLFSLFIGFSLPIFSNVFFKLMDKHLYTMTFCCLLAIFVFLIGKLYRLHNKQHNIERSELCK